MPAESVDVNMTDLDTAVDVGLGPDVRTGFINARRLPLFIEPTSDRLASPEAFSAWIRAHRPRLDDLIVEYGGIVLRGFPVDSAQAFSRFADQFPAYERGYVGGGAPRQKLAEKVLESTRMVETFKIPLHTEMSYMRRYPPRIAFFAKTSARTGGETIIGSMLDFMGELPPDLIARLRTRKVRSVRNYAPASDAAAPQIVRHSDDIRWNDVFGTSDRQAVDRICADLGIEPVWQDDGSLSVVEETDPLTRHPRTGDLIYRNNLHNNYTYGDGDTASRFKARAAHPAGMYLDDGSPLPEADADAVNAAFERVELAWRWRDRDIMILDNLLVAHGRNPFEGPREVMVALLG
jgi:alpha-ketoglutarate-dependent taurine dioxygenase